MEDDGLEQYIKQSPFGWKYRYLGKKKGNKNDDKFVSFLPTNYAWNLVHKKNLYVDKNDIWNIYQKACYHLQDLLIYYKVDLSPLKEYIKLGFGKTLTTEMTIKVTFFEFKADISTFKYYLFGITRTGESVLFLPEEIPSKDVFIMNEGEGIVTTQLTYSFNPEIMKVTKEEYINRVYFCSRFIIDETLDQYYPYQQQKERYYIHSFLINEIDTAQIRGLMGQITIPYNSNKFEINTLEKFKTNN